MPSFLRHFDSLRALSADEAAELAARVADLSKAGLPLGAGLRSFAAELSGRRLRRVLRDLADQLDAGADLATAMQSQGRRLPLCLQGLVLAGLHTGRLAEVLEEYVDLQHSQWEVRRRLWKSLAYPFVLLVFMAAIMAFARLFLMGGFESLFKGFGMDLPVLTQFVIAASWPAVWIVLGLVVVITATWVLLKVAPTAGWVWSWLYRVPMLGAFLRWGHMAQFGRLMGLLLDQQVPLPDALRLCAAGVRAGNLAEQCRAVAGEVELGRVFDESMAEQRHFPASLIPIVQWGQQAHDLPDAFRATAEMYEGRVRSQGLLMETILLPIMLLAIISFIGTFIAAMMLPLISLIQCLSWRPPTDDKGSELGLAALLIILVPVVVLSACLLASPVRRPGAMLLHQRFLFVLGVMGRVVLAVFLLGLLVCGFLLGITTPLAMFWWCVAIFVIVEGVRKHRASQQYALLWLVCVSIERSMPLVPAIEAFAREGFGLFRWRARQLAEMLKAGVPFPDALEECRDVLPPYVLPMIRVGWGSDALASALRRAAMAHASQQPVWMSLTGKVGYLLFLLAFGLYIVVRVNRDLVPEFEKIFRGFGTLLPAVTDWLIWCSKIVVDYCYLFAPLVLLALLLLMYAAARFFGWIRWDLPGMAQLARRLDSANVLDSLAVVTRRQGPLLDGIRSLAQSYPRPGVRRRLLRVAGDIQAGRDWGESLYARRLIRRADLAVLQAAQRAGNLAWAMREVADSNRRRFAYRLQSIAQALFPVAVIAIGAVVLFVAVALFQPLVSLIEVVSRT
jgi:type II secretory pathway component PulF